MEIKEYFIVNVNNCLPLSQYAPFFYEHIYRKELVLLSDIEDTCQLDKTFREVQAHINRKPFPRKSSVILLFIPRDLSMSLRPQDYELYNDINAYMHLLQYLDEKHMVYTVYVDRTDATERNDAVYQKLKAVSDSLQALYPELTSHFITLEEKPGTKDYKQYLQGKISALCDGMRAFYQHVLDHSPDMEATDIQFQNGMNHYIGEAKKRLSKVKHLYAPIYRMELAEEIEEWLKLIYYIKAMVKDQLLPEKMTDYEHYIFDQTDHVRRLLATYRNRLSIWSGSELMIEKESESTKWEFRGSSNAASVYQDKITRLIKDRLDRLNVGKIGGTNVVDAVFRELNQIIANAWNDLQALTEEQSRILRDPNSFQAMGKEPFRLDESDREDLDAEMALLEKTNQHSPGAGAIPDFSEENRLEQELEQINNQINQVLDNLKDYSWKTFFLTLLSAVLAVAGLYVGAQYSIFIKEHTWSIFISYLLVCAGVFGGAYGTERRRYKKEIDALLNQCVSEVRSFLRNFQLIAENFEQNIQTAGQYRCLKRQNEEKAAARKKYRQTMQQYAWHKMKVKQILRNLEFFDSFIGNAPLYEEVTVSPEPYNHDDEHTEFYHLKVFRS